MAGEQAMKSRDDKLVECPYIDGVWYFYEYCLEQKRAGEPRCVKCDAPEKTVTLAEILSADA